MSFPRILGIASVLLFGTIGVMAFLKGAKDSGQSSASSAKVSPGIPVTVSKETAVSTSSKIQAAAGNDLIPKSSEGLPDANRIGHLFNRGVPQLPIVETITYKSQVPWVQGRLAWLGDYAKYYGTSRHFIARSLNGKSNYAVNKLANGDRFNVFKKDKEITFHLLVDLSRCKMWFYYLDRGTNDRVLLKTYDVGVGRPVAYSPSGLLTPLGKFSLGEKIAIYKPKVTGLYQGNTTEMITVFGTRWVPFDKEEEGASAPAKGLGIHGVPWGLDEKTGELVETLNGVGRYESDGCVRLLTGDMEELFSIIVSKPTVIEIVKDYYDAKLPGVERKL